jgi:YegS/Rv2252/BmrU family lipid kinase
VRDRARIESLLSTANLSFRVAVSEYSGHCIELAAQAAKAGVRRFVAVGGDGTLNELVTGLLRAGALEGEPPMLALIPVGRGNDWARTHAIPRDYAAAVALIREGHVVAHDLGLVELMQDGKPVRRCFINVAGVGFDAYVVEQTRAARLGPFTYLVGLLRGFLGFRAPTLRIEADAIRLEQPLLVAFAAIARYCGGGMHVAPEARTDDGLLDVTLIGAVGKLELLLNLRRLFDGTLAEYRKVRMLREPGLCVACDHPVGVQADGELIGHTPATFTVLPRAVRVVVPLDRGAQRR